MLFTGMTKRPASASRVLCFYGHSQGKPYKEFSNFYWHDRPFKFLVPEYARHEGLPVEVDCEFSEKAIMLIKAGLMGDTDSFKKIVESSNPADCKSLGRRVSPFKEDLWQQHLKSTALEVVQQKFASDPKLTDLLLGTGDAIICEATRNDKIWGIGIDVGDPRVQDPSKWLGQNILGYALMEARANLRKQDEVHIVSEAPAGIKAESAKEQSNAPEDPPVRRRWQRSKEL